ncbi:hypothetical protein PG996_004618 [Apiospora saccharicola]|uniref:Uncharacterized protein n=1 Tax=Apiospora saccharicola TaxID=335842 RepID=A0ABR1W4L4_9PEZI
MSSPATTAAAVNVSASANHSPAAFTGSTDSVKIYMAAEETDGIEKIAGGLRMFADRLEAARTCSSSIQLPKDEEKASFRYDKAAVGIPTYSTRGSWNENCGHVAGFAVVPLFGKFPKQIAAVRRTQEAYRRNSTSRDAK